MKKLFALIFLLTLSLVCITCRAESSLPFTEEDYLREDFGIRDYEDYVTDSIDLSGVRWPEGTKAIAAEGYNFGKAIDKITPIEIPRTLEILGHGALTSRPITDEDLDFSTMTDLKYIGYAALDGTAVRRVDLSNTKVVRIGSEAFNNSSINVLITPPTLKRIDEFVAPYCSLGVLTLNEGLEYIGARAFSATKASPIYIPSTVKYIGANAFPENGNFLVHKGSYGELWCKALGCRYTLCEEAPESAATDRVVTLGPVKISKCMRYLVKERVFDDGLKKLYIEVYAADGTTVETVCDRTELYYTPSSIWRIDAKTSGTTGEVFQDYFGRSISLDDCYVTSSPSEKMDFGYRRGLKWTLKRKPHLALHSHYFTAVYDGVEYNYEIMMRTYQDYENFQNNTSDTEFMRTLSTPAEPTSSGIIVDGREVACEAYTISGNNYFKLRDVAAFVSGTEKQFDVIWNSEASAVEMKSSAPYTFTGTEGTAGDGTPKSADILNPPPVYKDGRFMVMKSYIINGNNYVRLRDLGEAFDFNVSWSAETGNILINTRESYTDN